jgi:decaprenylphospho-beta-D-ribofuranose 2-oxidase
MPADDAHVMPATVPTHRRELTGWGRNPISASDVADPISNEEVVVLLERAGSRGVIARGLGRGYGDGAQNAGGTVVETEFLDSIRLDPATGVVTASGGTSLDSLMRALVPRGFFVPVTPGTRQVSVGGAIAADIHGKNHHKRGSWCCHVESLRLATPKGVVEVGPDDDPELFWATAGGMGLTGVVLDATFRCPRIETSRLLVDTRRAPDLDTVMAIMDETDSDYDYTVAWIDLVARGRSLGRSVLGSGRFARLDELDRHDRDPLAFEPNLQIPTPPWAPSGLLNRLSIRAFNELWFRKSPTERIGELQTISQFFHPLDMFGNGWNRMYGRRGFFQWQFVVPYGAEETLRHVVETLSSTGCASFLAVLKRFGDADPGPLSFPIPGWTLALDIPVSAGIAEVLDRLDDDIAAVGGRVYLAKDSRLRRELLPRMYPRLDEFRAVRSRVDPDGVLQSDLARRLAI